MRRSRAEKEKTHARIIDAADRLFRARGYDAVRIDDIMAAIGMTRGGFYAHFESKEDLLKTVVGRVFFANYLREAASAGDDVDTSRQKVVDDYLSTGHRDYEGGGCPMASLAGRVAVADDAVRDAQDTVIRDLIDELSRQMPDGHTAPEAAAAATVAQCVGALILSRATADPDLSERLLAAGRWATRRLASLD